MADRGHELTEKMLQELERRIAGEYAIAAKEMREKVEKYLEQFAAREAEQKKLLDAGKITQKEYDNWRYRHTMIGKRWEALLDALASDAHNANLIARKMVAETTPGVYALNMNYETYNIERGGKIETGFVLYDHDAAEYLMRDRELMPGPSEKLAADIAANKDLQWNKRLIQSAVLQGIMQGDNPYDIAARMRGVAEMNYHSSIRYARTMTTSAQNAGRYEAFERAEKVGVDLTIEWLATLDGRTRHDHRMMHGQRRKVGEPFITPDGFLIMYPAQQGPGSSDIPQREIWNCRCTLNGWVKGFEGDTVKESPKMGGMSFEEWQQAKEHPWTAADKRQYEQYKALLGSKAPKSLYAFRAIKADPSAWENLKAAAREARKK